MRKVRTKYTEDILAPLVKDSTSVGAVIDKCGLRRTGGNYRQIQKWIRYWGIDTSHFKGQGWSKGETSSTNPSVKSTTTKNSYSNEQVFIGNSPLHGSEVAKRLKKLGWEYEYAVCGLSDWQGKEITLHVDHKNGIHNDNRLENLRYICPNCHQQTKNWGAKNKKKY